MIVGNHHTPPVPNRLPTRRRNEGLALKGAAGNANRQPPTADHPLSSVFRLLSTVHRPLLVICLLLLTITPAPGEVTDAQVKDVAVELACLCGDCPTRPLDECRCGHAGTQRNRIAEELAKGQTKDQIIAGFVADFGQRIFVTPPKEGFNLMAWFMPFFGILVGGYAVRSIMKGWSRTHTNGRPRTSAGSAVVSETDRAKLEEALGEQDT